MQQRYQFRRLFGFSIPFWVMSLFGCLPEKTSRAEKAELSTNTESSTKPGILWKTTATGSGEESHGHFLLSCSDGGFLQIGETGSLPTNARIFVVKVSQDGAIQWKKEYPSAGHNLGNGAIEVDDGYVVFGAMNQDSALIKLNKTTGEVVFSKSYDFGGVDAIESMIQLGSSLVAVGYINAQDSDTTFYAEGEGHLMKFDMLGNHLSDSSLNSYTSHAYRIYAFEDKLIIGGLTQDALDYSLIKMTGSGEVIWSKKYGGSGADHMFAMDLGPDGSIFLSGHTTSGTANWDTYTLKLDQLGNVIWENKVGNPRGFDPRYIHDEAWGVKATPDGGAIVVAGTGDEYESYSECSDLDCSDQWHAFLIRFKSDGNLLWKATYPNPEGGDWAGEDIVLTKDGGALMAVDDGQFAFVQLSSVY